MGKRIFWLMMLILVLTISCGEKKESSKGAGAEKEITVNSTNYYFIGKADPPSGITILGGKTGTTDAAGHCLVLLSRDTQNKPYISVIMRSDARENLYISMSELLAQIGN